MEPNWFEDVRAAFDDEALCNSILFAATNGDQTLLPPLFQHISRYVLALRAQSSRNSLEETVNVKKRKLEDDHAQSNNHVVPKPLSQPSRGVPVFECKDVSVQVPARKKMKVELVGEATTNKAAHQISLVNSTTSEVEYAISVEAVDEVFCLPVPDKQARQMNFALFPKPGALDVMGRPAEQLLFVMNETPPVGLHLNGGTVSEDDTYVTITHRALDRWLSAVGKRVTTPSSAEFASSIVQSHRRNEKAYHVKAHRGSKEGYLFFLPNGIVFGLKKPLAFFPFHAIESISYTSVLQRTFNLVISSLEDSGEVKEIEFAMIDQEDFAGIGAYVKRHGLNDASMAAQRQAKAYNVNRERKAEVNGDVEGGGVEDGGQTELQRAEQLLQDEEDEGEEDYEVSGGESEGEGEDSEEEEEGYEDEVDEVEGGYEDEDEDEDAEADE